MKHDMFDSAYWETIEKLNYGSVWFVNRWNDFFCMPKES